MKLSKKYITEQLKTMTIRELSEKITDELHAKYERDGTLASYAELGIKVDRDATVRKFYSMISPLTDKIN